MPQIEVPFLPGDKVRVKATSHALSRAGGEFEVMRVGLGKLGWYAYDKFGTAFSADELEAVKPVIEWRYVHANVWESADKWWRVSDAGTLACCGQIVGRFPDPRAVAEDTQTLWNERAKC